MRLIIILLTILICVILLYTYLSNYRVVNLMPPTTNVDDMGPSTCTSCTVDPNNNTPPVCNTSYLQLTSLMSKLKDNTTPANIYSQCLHGSYVEGTIPHTLQDLIPSLNKLLFLQIKQHKPEWILDVTNVDKVSFYRHEQNYILRYECFYSELTTHFAMKLYCEWLIMDNTGAFSQKMAYIPKETIGYPAMNQWVPLPEHVIVTGREALAPPPNRDIMEGLTVYLNAIRVLGCSDVLGYQEPNRCMNQNLRDNDAELEHEVIPLELTSTERECSPTQPPATIANKWIRPTGAPVSPVSPLPEVHNATFYWNEIGLPTKWVSINDKHIAQPWSAPNVTGTAVSQTGYTWLFERQRQMPSYPSAHGQS